MRNKKIILILSVIILVTGLIVWKVKLNSDQSEGIITQEIQPAIGPIQRSFSTTGSVLPLNRLEVKPPVGGRIEEVLVKEGDEVNAGQILVWMSSTERAALLDAARGQSEEQRAYWNEVYKPIPLMASINAKVIVAKIQPGQTVTANDAVMVLSDRLIVRAQVDETDIGKVKVGQDAVIELDAYPDTKIAAKTGHVYYESKTVNNVTIYEVDLIPESVPEFFRSGMNAAINFIENRKDDALLLPLDALTQEEAGSFIMVKAKDKANPIQRQVKTGISNGQNIEIVSGLDINDIVIVKTKKYSLPQAKTSSNPLVPPRGRRPGAQKK
ncbi:MAG: efflux RND transporter periplasmic adaptor subunit [Candidatus Omnitrophica bacterium]|nr:efflux RND transporter periplasmic adaptor subunit [Candidatus Omnitrophota bacterium]